MTQIYNTKATILTLPKEILDMIWQQLEKRELKSTRQTCKFLRDLGTPMLFADFVLYPHMRSLERLVSISESENIRFHVRHFRYNALFEGIPEKFTKHIKSVWSQYISSEEKERLLEQTHNLQREELDIHRHLDHLVQTEYLSRTFPRLENLESIMLHETVGHTPVVMREDLPDFYEQMHQETCGRYAHTRLPKGHIGMKYRSTSTYLQTLLVAMATLKKPLQRVDFIGIQWNTCETRGDVTKFASMYQSHFANLHTLRLLGDVCDNMPLESLRFVQNILKMSSNIETLDLVLNSTLLDRTYPSDGRDPPLAQTSIFQCPYIPKEGSVLEPRLIWCSGLRNFSLCGLRCTVKEFKNVLQPCLTSLEILRLGDIILVPEAHQLNELRPCWVKTIKWMQRRLTKLRQVDFDGLISNGGLQTWFVEEISLGSKDLLRSQVMKYIVEGGQCPLEAFAIKPGEYDFMMPNSTSEQPGPLTQGGDVPFDPSWWLDTQFFQVHEASDISDMESFEDEDIEDEESWDSIDEDVDDDDEDIWQYNNSIW